MGLRADSTAAPQSTGHLLRFDGGSDAPPGVESPNVSGPAGDTARRSARPVSPRAAASCCSTVAADAGVFLAPAPRRRSRLRRDALPAAAAMPAAAAAASAAAAVGESLSSAVPALSFSKAALHWVPVRPGTWCARKPHAPRATFSACSTASRCSSARSSFRNAPDAARSPGARYAMKYAFGSVGSAAHAACRGFVHDAHSAG